MITNHLVGLGQFGGACVHERGLLQCVQKNQDHRLPLLVNTVIIGNLTDHTFIEVYIL